MRSFRRLVWEPWLADLAAWERGGWTFGRAPHRQFLALVRYNGLRATLFYRLAFWGREARLPLLPTLFTQLNVALHSFECPPNVPIGPGLYLPHTVGTVVSAESVGSNVTVQSSVTIGQRRGNDFPVIEDGVVVGTGAKVLGTIRVGAGSNIGANSVVLEDVPAGATVVGVPARVISRSPAHSEANGYAPGALQAEHAGAGLET